MKILKMILAIFLATVSAAITFSGLHLGASILEITHPGASVFSLVLYSLTIIIASSVVFYFVMVVSWRWLELELKRAQAKPTIFVVIVFCYFVSWTFGVPATQTSITMFAVNEYKRITVFDQRVREEHPK